MKAKVAKLRSKVSELEETKLNLGQIVACRDQAIELLKKKEVEKDEILDNLWASVATGYTEKSNLETENRNLRSQIAEKDKTIKELKGQAQVQCLQLESFSRIVKTRGSTVYAVYSEVLSKFGARTLGYVVTRDPEKFFDWLDSELEGLAETVFISSEYCAKISAQSLLQTLDSEGCEHLKENWPPGIQIS